MIDSIGIGSRTVDVHVMKLSRPYVEQESMTAQKIMEKQRRDVRIQCAKSKVLMITTVRYMLLHIEQFAVETAVRRMAAKQVVSVSFFG